MQSHFKRWWGWKKNHTQDINWGTDYGVMSSIRSIPHGTGWTQNSWQITYFKRLFPVRIALFSGLPDVSYQFTYNTTTLINLESTNATCEDDCF